MKKLIAFLLVLCMNIGVVSIAVEEMPTVQFPDVVATQCEQAVTELARLEILTGYEDGTFRPQESLTRAEFSTVITRVLDLEKEVLAAEGDQNFIDIEAGHWAAAYINVILKKNIIRGYGDGRFGPEDPVTYEQAVKMLVQALGYSEMSEQKASYPWGHILVAAEKGIITKQVQGELYQPASRGLIAKMLYNALNVIMGDGIDVKLVEYLTGRTYYLSPKGSDSGPGTKAEPWKTLKKAAETIEAGATVILQDGEYNEPGPTYFKNSGTERAPIVVRAQNKQKAKLVYPESARLTAKMVIAPGQGHFTIEGLHFTQLSMAKDDDATKTTDIFITCRGTDVKFIGNRFERAFEEAIKLSGGSERILIDGNTITQMTHEGIDSLNSLDVIIRNNHISEVGRVGIMVKGGARNNVVYNNYISNKERTLGTAAVTVGGVTNNTSPYSIKKDEGHEAYNCVFYNNIIYSQSPELIRAGFSYIGAKDCKVYNNVVIGTRNAIAFRHPNGIYNGWEWDPTNVNPVIKNNIFMNTVGNTFEFVTQPVNLVADNNLYYNSKGAPMEANGVYADPKFEEFGISWKLMKDSPAIGAGEELPSEMDGFGGTKVQIDLVDYEGDLRTTPWDIGAYAVK